MPRSRADLAYSPLRLARKNLGLSIESFAELCKVHEQALYLNECGCYVGLLPAVGGVLDAHGFDLDELENEYVVFQRERRDDFSEQFGCRVWGIADLGTHKLDRSPISQLRDRLSLSQLGFAKGICVQPAIVYKCEKGRAVGLPEQLKGAFHDVGLTETLIVELDDRQNEFYFFVNNSTNGSSVR